MEKTQHDKTCLVDSRCGGCTQVAVPYAEQLAAKDAAMSELFSSLVDVAPDGVPEPLPIRGMSDPFHYRDKVTSPFAPGRKIGGGDRGTRTANDGGKVRLARGGEDSRGGRGVGEAPGAAGRAAHGGGEAPDAAGRAAHGRGEAPGAAGRGGRCGGSGRGGRGGGSGSNARKSQGRAGAKRRGLDREVLTGMYEAGTHRLVPTDSCLVENEQGKAVVRAVRSMMQRFGIPPYNEDTGAGFMRHAVVRVGHESGEVLVTLVTNAREFPASKQFCRELVRRCPFVTTVVQNVNTRQTNVILGTEEHTLYGPGFILDTLCGLSFRISSQSFYQVNCSQTEVLYDTAVRFALGGLSDGPTLGKSDTPAISEGDAGLAAGPEGDGAASHQLASGGLAHSGVRSGDGNDALPQPASTLGGGADEPGRTAFGLTVIDAYCGTGTIGLVAAKRGAARVIGVESVGKAVADARQNARHNGIENATFVTADAGEFMLALASDFAGARTHAGDFPGNAAFPPRLGQEQERAHAGGFQGNAGDARGRHVADSPLDSEALASRISAQTARAVADAVGDEPLDPARTVLMMDPPRAGSNEDFLRATCAFAPARIVYISCNPQTQVRDLRYLLAHGYRLDRIQPVDMFPHTDHVETVVLMSKVNTPGSETL